MRRLISVVLVVVLAATAFIGLRWYRYVSNTSSPYDEVGIEINSRLPASLSKWGCDKLHVTFGNVPPPYGCGSTDGNTWR